MSIRTHTAPLALLLAAASAPAFAQTASTDQATQLDTVIVTAQPNPEDPPVVAGPARACPAPPVLWRWYRRKATGTAMRRTSPTS